MKEAKHLNQYGLLLFNLFELEVFSCKKAELVEKSFEEIKKRNIIEHVNVNVSMKKYLVHDKVDLELFSYYSTVNVLAQNVLLTLSYNDLQLL